MDWQEQPDLPWELVAVPQPQRLPASPTSVLGHVLAPLLIRSVSASFLF